MVSMASVAAIAVLIVFFGAFSFYAFYLRYFPPPPGPPPLIPQAPDFLMVAFFLLVCLIIAIFFALRLARRILTPLNSLAESARKIAAGDLSARAAPGDRSLGETARLVDDFNAMARRMEEGAAQMRAWNAAIAHELRTPLTILRGRLQGLTDGVFEPSDELFKNLLAQVEGLSLLVEDLRVVTLSELRRLEPRLADTDLSQPVGEAVEAMRPALIEAGFVIALDNPSILLACDGPRLRQALLALLENARKYAHPGPLRIAIAAEPDQAIISVEDCGPGLPENFAPYAFDSFSRVEASRSRRYGGSGLGLAVVRGIVEAHGGAARYRRAAGGGAIFEMVLPRRNGGG